MRSPRVGPLAHLGASSAWHDDGARRREADVERMRRGIPTRSGVGRVGQQHGIQALEQEDASKRMVFLVRTLEGPRLEVVEVDGFVG